MAHVHRTFGPPADQASDTNKLAEGDAGGSLFDNVPAGLGTVRERDAMIDNWLRKEVAFVYDCMIAEPSRGVSADDVAKALNLRHGKLT